MTVEYVLLLSLFAFIALGALVNNPQKSFNSAGPKLGARVEKQLATGDGFGQGPSTPLKWE